MSAELVKKLVECKESFSVADTQRCYEEGQEEFQDTFQLALNQLAACLDLVITEIAGDLAPSTTPSAFVNEPKVEFLGPK